MSERCGHGVIVIDAFDSSSFKLAPAFTSGHVLIQHRDIQDRDGRSRSRRCGWLNLAEFSSGFRLNPPLLHCSIAPLLHCSIAPLDAPLVSCEFLVSAAISTRSADARIAERAGAGSSVALIVRTLAAAWPCRFDRVNVPIKVPTLLKNMFLRLCEATFLFSSGSGSWMLCTKQPFCLRLWQNSRIFDRCTGVSI